MIAANRNYLPSLLLPAIFFTIQAAPAQMPEPRAEPQIVRLSLVEGDVRVSRGERGEKASGAAWQKAAVDVPMETGFSLVTGDGRAEIEFEDASVVYLADNSVLTFKDLSTTDGVPLTILSLLSGTLTLDVTTRGSGEQFYVVTPASSLHLADRGRSFVRIDSYLDAMAMTPQENSTIHIAGIPVPALDGQTSVYRNGRRVSVNVAEQSGAFAEWDRWVSGRVGARTSAVSAAMKAAGLSAPVPGLAEMSGQGRFFACEPYGTCWEPTNGWAGAAGGPAQGNESPAVNVAAQSASSLPLRPRRLLTEDDDYFPCSPEIVRHYYDRDPVTLKPRLVDTEFLLGWEPYRWGVCHTGSWIHRGHRYAWVVGSKRHHHCPVHWVKSGGKVGFVPIHPRDVKGKTPLNMEHGLFTVRDRKGQTVEHVGFDPAQHVKVLDGAPKEFRRDYFAPLQRAEAPHMEAHALHETLVATKDGGPVRPVATPITFDHKSQSFMMAREVNRGGRTSTVVEPVGGRGSFLQARSGGGGGVYSRGGGGGYAGGGSRSSGGGGSRGGGGSSGGGFHGGSSGGSSGGGGGHASASSGGGSAAASSASGRK